MTLALVSEDQGGNQERDSTAMVWCAVDPESLPSEWPMFALLVRQALAAGDESYSERDVKFALLSGQTRLWVYSPPDEMPESICITEVMQFPQQRKCLVRYIAGEWQSFANNLHQIVAYAQSQGCQRIEAYMRKGLTRKLPPEWTVRHVFAVRNC